MPVSVIIFHQRISDNFVGILPIVHTCGMLQVIIELYPFSMADKKKKGAVLEGKKQDNDQ